ncbi:MAG: FAD-dependent oxidoreductase, partial [Rubrivivax sp.]|nr:FAD-dependent oxidoreductase [Rubrivivax sp.]
GAGRATGAADGRDHGHRPARRRWRRVLRRLKLPMGLTQIELATRLMLREDEEVSAFARQALQDDGVAVLTGHQALRCEKVGDEKFIVVDAGGQEGRLAFDVLLCAVGRVARLSGFGLEELGIPVQRTVVADGYLQAIYPNILAAGGVAVRRRVCA